MTDDLTDALYVYHVVVERVIDGDTIVASVDLGMDVWLAEQHLRLYGIDTPEIRTRDLAHKRHGLEAKQFVLELLPAGRRVIAKTFRDRSGSFGRYLVDIWLDDKSMWLTQALREAGLEKQDSYAPA